MPLDTLRASRSLNLRKVANGVLCVLGNLYTGSLTQTIRLEERTKGDMRG